MEMEGQQWTGCLTSLTVDCLSLCLCVSYRSLRVKMTRDMTGLSDWLRLSVGWYLAGQRETRLETSRETRSTLPRWQGSVQCGQRCGESGARRSRWPLGLGTALRPCRGRIGSRRAKHHGSTPRNTSTWSQLSQVLPQKISDLPSSIFVARRQLLCYFPHFIFVAISNIIKLLQLGIALLLLTAKAVFCHNS